MRIFLDQNAVNAGANFIAQTIFNKIGCTQGIQIEYQTCAKINLKGKARTRFSRSIQAELNQIQSASKIAA